MLKHAELSTSGDTLGRALTARFYTVAWAFMRNSSLSDVFTCTRTQRNQCLQLKILFPDNNIKCSLFSYCKRITHTHAHTRLTKWQIVWREAEQQVNPAKLTHEICMMITVLYRKTNIMFIPPKMQYLSSNRVIAESRESRINSCGVFCFSDDLLLLRRLSPHDELSWAKWGCVAVE